MAGLAAALGSGAMTNSINEIPYNDLLFVIGANPPEAHPVIGAKMRQALARGASLIVVDPRRTELAEQADIWLQLRPGTDIALLNGIMHLILQHGWQKTDFIHECTQGFDEFTKTVATYTPDRVEAITGVPAQKILAAARLYAQTDRAGIYYTLGITEHICGTDNVLSVANLALLTGHLGRPYTGVNPLRGQNNVQGACDAGALPNYFPGYQKTDDPLAQAKFSQAWGAALSKNPGHTLPDMFDAAVAGQVKCMYIMGEDPVLSDANALHVRKGLETLDFLVVQNLFLTETAKLADVVLPAASFAEKDGCFANTERRIQRVRKAIEPIGQSRPDSDIIIELANRLGYPMHYGHPSEIMAEMASLAPIYAGVCYERLDGKGLQWPVPYKNHPGTQFLHENGQFTCGFGKFHAVEHQPPDEEPDAEYPFLLSTGRILYHYNMTTVGRSRWLTEFRPAEQVMVHPADACKLKISDGDWLEVKSRRSAVAAQVWVTDRVLPGMVWLSFHYPDCPTNEVTNGAYDKVTKTYEYKVCAVQLRKRNPKQE